MMKHAAAICLVTGLCCWSCGRPRLATDTMLQHTPQASPAPAPHQQVRATPQPTFIHPADTEIELVPVDGTRLPLQPTSGSPRRYTVCKGDTLAEISQRFYGSPHHWKRIWQYNRKVIATPQTLKHGTVITIP